MLQTTHVYLFNDKNQILLGMKKRNFGQGKWNGFGGKNQVGETIVQTALRELEEEAGISLLPEQIEKVGMLHFYWQTHPEWNQDIHIFWGKYQGDFRETDEMRPQWRDFDAIPYDKMWEDDVIWLPKLLAQEIPLDMSFTFDADGKLL